VDGNRYSVVLAHVDPARRSDLRRAFDGSPHFSVVGAVTTGVDVLAQVRHKTPDAVVLGLLLPAMNALEVLPKIRASSPLTVSVVVVSEPTARLERIASDRGADLCEAEAFPDYLVARLMAELQARRRSGW
jgi:DNA-binding NarL/FixJ family response regulator